MPLDVLYEDNHLLVVDKPNGILVQGDHTDRETLLEQARQYTKEKYNKPGNVFMGLVHRLDRTVSGVMVFARTSKAAGRVSEQIRNRKVTKVYTAIVEGQTPDEGTYEDEIALKRFGAEIVEPGKGKLARLHFQTLERRKKYSLVRIQLETGRRHQIRIQFASRGHAILGDHKYGSKVDLGKDKITLHAERFELRHPTKQDKLVFEAPTPKFWNKYS